MCVHKKSLTVSFRIPNFISPFRLSIDRIHPMLIIEIINFAFKKTAIMIFIEQFCLLKNDIVGFNWLAADIIPFWRSMFLFVGDTCQFLTLFCFKNELGVHANDVSET